MAASGNSLCVSRRSTNQVIDSWLSNYCTVNHLLLFTGYLPQNLYSLDSSYGSEDQLKSLLQTMHQHNVRAMADIVINHRVGTTKGEGGVYNRFDGIPMPWDEHAVTSCSGGKVKFLFAIILVITKIIVLGRSIPLEHIDKTHQTSVLKLTFSSTRISKLVCCLY